MASITLTPTRLSSEIRREGDYTPLHTLRINTGDAQLTLHSLTLDEIAGLADRIKAECEALAATSDTRTHPAPLPG